MTRDRSLVVVCGGRGASGFTAELLGAFQSVTFLMSAYDDGLSTGRIRRHLGILGPSDPAKNLVTLSAARHGLDSPLAQLLAYRFDDDVSSQWAMARLAGLGAPATGERAPEADLACRLPKEIRWPVRDYVAAFVARVRAVARDTGREFDARALAVRNAVLVGATLLHGGYNAALAELTRLIGSEGRLVVSSETPGFLLGVLDSGELLPTEAEVSDWKDPQRIRRVHVSTSPVDGARFSAGSSAAATIARLEQDLPNRSVSSSAASEALTGADAIVLAPGTFYSSIVPTLIDVRTEFAATRAAKILVANLSLLDQAPTLDRQVDAIASHVSAEGADSGLTHLVLDETRHRAEVEMLRRDRTDGLAIHSAELADSSRPYRHRPRELTQLLCDLVR